MKRKPLIAGNWKMYKSSREAASFAEELRRRLAKMEGVEVIVCPPFTALSTTISALAGSPIGVGAQDLFWEDEGAFTGEVSPRMIREIGCRYVLVGHSERRQFFGETDETVRRKTKAALRSGLLPIVCIGETLKEREGNQTEQVLTRQIEGLCREEGKVAFGAEEFERLTIAYEPVWAIGTGKTATPEQAQEAHRLVREKLAVFYRDAVRVRILYGGSVKPENTRALIQKPDVDGALVGGASLSLESFVSIVEGACLEVQEKVS